MRLVAEELAVERGGRLLFSGLSFALGAGEALALRGANGAGKTTLLRLLAGFFPPFAGQARLEGSRDSLGGSCHFLGTENAMKPALSLIENLGFWRQFLLAAEGGDGVAPMSALDAVGLAPLADLPFAVLSTGQKRRAGLARLLLRHRPVWLLDEPASGLDEASEALLARLMGIHLGAGGIVVAALHGRAFAPFSAEMRLEAAA